MRKTKLALVILGFGLSACAPVGKEVASRLAEETSASVDCKSVDSYFFNSLFSIPLKGEEFPSSTVVEEALRERLQGDFEHGRLKTSNQEDIEAFITQYMKLYRLSTVDVPKALKLKDSNEVVAALSALELGDRTSEEKRLLQERWNEIKTPLSAAAQALSGGCEELPPEDPEELPLVEPVKTPLLNHLEATYSTPVFGAMKTVAVAYQSCGVLNLDPMDTNSPSVKGVEVYGKHPNGVGNLRKVASLSDVISTHYYIRNQYAPENSCANLRESPLIYDYGGKPYAASSMEAPLDLFRNAGSGAPGLGIDCSGYVFTAYATAGLKLRSDQPLKASQVYGVSSSMMKEPQNNGLNCMSKTYGDLKPGDVIASSGHVVMVDAVGEDPFGVGNISRESDCVASKMSYTRFDFVISQSSPSKGAIGINRMLAADYFATSSTMADGLKHYAVSACKKRFGVAHTASTTAVSVTRHKGTASCKAEPVKLVKQECLSSCQASAAIYP